MSTQEKSTQEKNETAPDAAAPQGESTPKKYEGQFVSVADNKLVMTSKAGREHSHTLAKDAEVSCDGATCKPEDLKAGSKIRVTTQQDDRNVATCVESLDKNAEFAQCAS